MKIVIVLILSIAAMFSLSSCARVPAHRISHVAYPAPLAAPLAFPPALGQETVHLVAPGETLWRIGKRYGVSVDELMRRNGIRSPQELARGQRLIIPRAAVTAGAAIPLYASTKWKYIIIHHSATSGGSAFFFNRMHHRRGFWKGIGYHFVIDNGSYGKQDGQIEVSPRWTKQEDGAHCQAGGMNHQGIGICLVGNFSKEGVSDKAMDSLAYLVNQLRKYYGIPITRIVAHGKVSGARTECPGKRFPWSEFCARLAH